MSRLPSLEIRCSIFISVFFTVKHPYGDPFFQPPVALFEAKAAEETAAVLPDRAGCRNRPPNGPGLPTGHGRRNGCPFHRSRTVLQSVSGLIEIEQSRGPGLRHDQHPPRLQSKYFGQRLSKTSGRQVEAVAGHHQVVRLTVPAAVFLPGFLRHHRTRDPQSADLGGQALPEPLRGFEGGDPAPPLAQGQGQRPVGGPDIQDPPPRPDPALQLFNNRPVVVVMGPPALIPPGVPVPIINLGRISDNRSCSRIRK